MKRTATVTIERENYQTKVHTGKHHFVSDEPASLGGKNTGPEPYQLLLSALGSCTAITLRMYADRKGWPLEKVELHLTYQSVKTKKADAANEGHKSDQISIQARFFGDLTEEQRQRLKEIAEKCPVHKSLKAGFSINAEITDKEL